MQTRVLFLDDSGKPDANHPSAAVVIAGFSIPADAVPTLSRRALGAKGATFPQRGQPTTWEVKAGDIIKPNPWKRSKNRQFAYELIRIVGSLGGTVYSAAIEKAKMNHAMTLTQTMPLQLQVLVEHFEAECRFHGETGMVVADWSSHHADQHASNCVASFVASRRLNLHPSVYYASSLVTPPIQLPTSSLAPGAASPKATCPSPTSTATWNGLAQSRTAERPPRSRAARTGPRFSSSNLDRTLVE